MEPDRVKKPFDSVADVAPAHPLATVDALTVIGTTAIATNISSAVESAQRRESAKPCIVARDKGEGGDGKACVWWSIRRWFQHFQKQSLSHEQISI